MKAHGIKKKKKKKKKKERQKSTDLFWICY